MTGPTITWLPPHCQLRRELSAAGGLGPTATFPCGLIVDPRERLDLVIMAIIGSDGDGHEAAEENLAAATATRTASTSDPADRWAPGCSSLPLRMVDRRQPRSLSPEGQAEGRSSIGMHDSDSGSSVY
ncbi:hypothetical protein HPB47_007361 [Ixodes persulcatus]|uniref:Uncharacterized protein n=1 Tax=Ixodes persulcatus TaxID=34615 RepID=A0AC60P850_IXOPE|nr:hypothetical protein HPB47_007361 [Ixodes persulcatus]